MALRSLRESRGHTTPGGRSGIWRQGALLAILTLPVVLLAIA